MRGARGSSVAAAGPPRPLRRVFSRRTESGAREAKSVRGNTAAADGPGARLAAPVASRSPAVVLRCLQLPSLSQRVALGACVPGSLLPALGSPRDARPLHPHLQHPARRKALALQRLSPRPWEVRVRSGGTILPAGARSPAAATARPVDYRREKFPMGATNHPQQEAASFFPAP